MAEWQIEKSQISRNGGCKMQCVINYTGSSNHMPNDIFISCGLTFGQMSWPFYYRPTADVGTQLLARFVPVEVSVNLS